MVFPTFLNLNLNIYIYIKYIHICNIYSQKTLRTFWGSLLCGSELENLLQPLTEGYGGAKKMTCKNWEYVSERSLQPRQSNTWNNSSVQSLSSTLCYHMGFSTPGFPVHHQFPELAQIHVHRISDAIQLSHPLSSPSPPAFNLAQHQGLFQ